MVCIMIQPQLRKHIELFLFGLNSLKRMGVLAVAWKEAFYSYLLIDTTSGSLKPYGRQLYQLRNE